MRLVSHNDSQQVKRLCKWLVAIHDGRAPYLTHYNTSCGAINSLLDSQFWVSVWSASLVRRYVLRIAESLEALELPKEEGMHFWSSSEAGYHGNPVQWVCWTIFTTYSCPCNTLHISQRQILQVCGAKMQQLQTRQEMSIYLSKPSQVSMSRPIEVWELGRFCEFLFWPIIIRHLEYIKEQIELLVKCDCMNKTIVTDLPRNGCFSSPTLYLCRFVKDSWQNNKMPIVEFIHQTSDRKAGCEADG